MVFMHENGQSVGEHKLGVWNVGNGDIYSRCGGRRFVGRCGLRRDRRGLGSRRLGHQGNRISDEQGYDGEQAHRSKNLSGSQECLHMARIEFEQGRVTLYPKDVLVVTMVSISRLDF